MKTLFEIKDINCVSRAVRGTDSRPLPAPSYIDCTERSEETRTLPVCIVVLPLACTGPVLSTELLSAAAGRDEVDSAGAGGEDADREALLLVAPRPRHRMAAQRH